MGKSTISMAISNSYVKLPEGMQKWKQCVWQFHRRNVERSPDWSDCMRQSLLGMGRPLNGLTFVSQTCVLEEVVSCTPLLSSTCERRGWIFFTSLVSVLVTCITCITRHNTTKKNLIPSLESKIEANLFSPFLSFLLLWSTCLGAKLPGISSCIEGLDGAPAFNLGGWASLKKPPWRSWCWNCSRHTEIYCFYVSFYV